MNWNPYKRPDYKNMSDAELAETQKKLHRKALIAIGVNLTGAVFCLLGVAALIFPAALPAIPTFSGSWMVAVGVLSINRFSTLESECRTETHERRMAQMNPQLENMISAPIAEPAPTPAPAPSSAPEFNGAAATVLEGDLEITRPLKLKKKTQQPAALA